MIATIKVLSKGGIDVYISNEDVEKMSSIINMTPDELLKKLTDEVSEQIFKLSQSNKTLIMDTWSGMASKHIALIMSRPEDPKSSNDFFYGLDGAYAVLAIYDGNDIEYELKKSLVLTIHGDAPLMTASVYNDKEKPEGLE